VVRTPVNITRSDVNALYDPTRGRYRWVYPIRSKWQAIISLKKDDLLYLGTFDTQAEAASAVAGWFKERYGSRWAEVADPKTRATPPSTVGRRTPGARYFTVRTWVWGQAVVVTGDLVTNKRGAVDSRWATYKDARRAAREFQARLSGGVDAMGRPALLRVS
jgi:hypothetical protein